MVSPLADVDVDTARTDAMAFDCDCGWERELDAWGPPPPPPTFDLPPPPVPPSLIAATTAAAAASDAALFLDDLCSDDAPSQDTCQAFLVSTWHHWSACS